MNQESLVQARRRKRTWKKIKGWLTIMIVLLMVMSMLMLDLSHLIF